MAQQSAEMAPLDPVLTNVARLVLAADGDTVYRDAYLRRASELLAPIVSEAQFDSALARREQLARTMAQAKAAVARQDWRQVRDLSARAADLRQALDAERSVLDVAEAVYGAPAATLDPLSPGLTSPSKRWANGAAAHAAIMTTLADLARDEPGARELYVARQRALAPLAVSEATAAGAARAAAPSAGTADVERRALQALERGDASALQALAESMLGAVPPTPAASSGSGSVPTTHGRLTAPDVLGEPLPPAVVTRAGALGLEAVVVTLASPAVAAVIADFMARYAPGASAAGHTRARDGIARVTIAAEEVNVPSELLAVFAETLSLFALHQFVNSAGVRYVPVPAARETLLVESHADGDDTATPLLRALGLERRRGLARDHIEERLWRNGARILADQLGLDPLGFRLVCIPQDVFVRLGRDRGWGRRAEWTHFDGYQVLAGNRLRALVGGHVRFGGLYDLCSIARDDARENTLARFAVVRRERLEVRIG